MSDERLAIVCRLMIYEAARLCGRVEESLVLTSFSPLYGAFRLKHIDRPLTGAGHFFVWLR